MSVSEQILTAYAHLLVEADGTAISVTDICRFCEIHRTTFYRYFESIDDLDERFLSLLVAKLKVDENYVPESMNELMRYYETFVAVMNEHRAFFSAIWHRRSLADYMVRWTNLVAEIVLRRFRKVTPPPVSEPWKLHHEFGKGVIGTYLYSAMHLEAGQDLRHVTFFCVEFLHGAYRQIAQITQRPMTYSDRAFDDILQQYALIVSQMRRIDP